MARKKAVKKTARKKPERSKGGFGVFVESPEFPLTMDTNLEDDAPVASDKVCLIQIASDLKDTQDALRWVKENAEEHEGKTLVIAQVKTRLTCAVKKMVQVRIEEV